jgi:hypothetical protein
MHGGHNIVWGKCVARAHADGFMPALTEGSAHAAALFPERYHIFVKGARKLHPVEEVKLLLAR